MSTSVRRSVFFALFLAAACGEAENQAPENSLISLKAAQPSVAASPVPTDPREPTRTPEQAGSAADVLRSYYRLIEQRDYAAAQRLREQGPRGPSLAEFKASFERYSDHRVTIGAPSEVAEGGDWLYVEVPVQSYGTLINGEPFGSAGTITLRRPRTKPNAPWRIYTGR